MSNIQQTQVKVKDPIQVTREQQSRVQNNRYVIRKMDETQYNIDVSKISEKSYDNQLRRNVRDAIIKNLGRDRYAAFDDLKIKQEGGPEEESIVLNHAQGSKLTLEGEDVLEFNMAGSSYMLYNLPHKGLKGDDPTNYYQEDKKVSWYNRSKLLTWTKLVRTERQIQEYNAAHKDQNEKIEREYGQKIDSRLKGQKMNQIRKKESVNSANAQKTRFYMRGPNVQNTGKYKETNLEEYILQLGIKTLISKFELLSFLDKEDLAKQKKINIIIQGHSRGAVASGLGAMRLKRWISDNYPSLVDMVKFQLIQYDPVAGDYENFGNNAKIDHAPANKKDEKIDSRYMSLGESADTTVVYSLHTQYPGFFTPQYVKNAKRIILTAANHSANLLTVDETQDKPSRVTYLAEKNGQVEAFRSTGLAELDEGVFIADDQNNLIRIRNLEEYDALAKTLLSGTIMQGGRHEIVRKAVAAWFTRESENQLKEKMAPQKVQKKPEEKIDPKNELMRRDLTSLTTPARLKKVQEEKDKLDKMPRDTTAHIKKFREKQEKYLKAKKSGMINYVDWLHKQNSDYISKTRQNWLHDLIDLSYQLEKEKEGYQSKDRQEKIATLTASVRQLALTDDLDSFLPAYLKRELYLGSEEKLKEYLGIKAPESKEKKAEEKKAEEKKAEEKKAEEKKAEEKKAEEAKPAEEVKEKAEEKKAEEVQPAEENVQINAMKFNELPFVNHDVQTDISGMDKAYEDQDINNCFCVVGSAMLNHFIARRKNEKTVTRRYSQKDFRNFKPEVRKFDPANRAGLEQSSYNDVIHDLNDYAGEGKMGFGSIFDMGDFLLSKLSDEHIENVMLNRLVLNLPAVKKENKVNVQKKNSSSANEKAENAEKEKTAEELEKEAAEKAAKAVEKERDKAKIRNCRTLFADKISQIITEGGVAGVLITKGKNPHYVTITGIKGDELTIYDSIDYTGGPVTRKLDDFMKKADILEVTWLSDKKSDEELKAEYPNLESDGQNLKLKDESYSEYYSSITHTKGITVAKKLEGNAEGMDDVSQMAYIPQQNLAVEKKQLDEAAAEVLAYRQEQERKVKEEKRIAARKKAAQQFDRSVSGIFSELFLGRGVFSDIMKNLDTSFDSEDNEKVSYNRMRVAAERVSKLAARTRDPKQAPDPAELMEAVSALSESATVYFDLHRGHQYTTRGQKRREACDSIRALVGEYYDRLDLKTGGKGLGNTTESVPQAKTTSKEIKEAGSKVRELYDKYQKLKDHFSGPERTYQDNIQEKVKLFASYERYIEIYKATHSIKKRSKEIDEMIRAAAFYRVQNSVIKRFEDFKGKGGPD